MVLFYAFWLKKNFVLLIIITLTLLTTTSDSYAQSRGETIFKNSCQACHSIGGGRMVGPDLNNISDNRSDDWLISFVRSSQSMIKAGDPDAVAIFEEYNKVIMPDQMLSDDEIKDVLNFIQEQSSAGFTADLSKPVQHSSGLKLEEASHTEFETGRKLFSGEMRLSNGGASCISCHNVVNDDLISGGLLAADLTNAFSKLSAQGVHSVISNPPFPVMKTAYANHPVTSDEAFYLTAFLKNADFVSSIQDPPVPQQRFLYAGILGGIVLFALYGGLWWNRKRKSVNHSIYKRQLKSI